MKRAVFYQVYTNILRGISVFGMLGAAILGQPAVVCAQNLSLGVAQYVPIKGENIPNGSIISLKDNVYQLSTEPYDKGIVGVMSTAAAMQIRYGGQADGFPVISSGRIAVRVNAENGPIQAGDRLTSSSIPGVAMRAPKTGFILGVAQTDFTPTGGESDVVMVDLKIGFDFASDSPKSEQIGSRLLSVISASAMAIQEDPLTVTRYVLSSVVMISTLTFTFFTFARTVRSGMEALGRNPIAASQIVLGMVFNVLISLAIFGTGLGAAYFIVSV